MSENHKRETKKPKGFKPGSRKGQIREGIYAKIKEAREQGHAWLSHPAAYGRGREIWRLKIEPPTPENVPDYGLSIRRVREGQPSEEIWAFLRCKAGIGLYAVHDYKGERLVASMHSFRTITEDDILAIVTERQLRTDDPELESS